MAVSIWLQNRLLDHVLRGEAYAPPADCFVSLHATAYAGDVPSPEVAGGDYERLAVSATAAADGESETDAVLTWTGMPETDVAYAGLWDAQVGGNLLMHGPISPARTVPAGDEITVPVGELRFSLHALA